MTVDWSLKFALNFTDADLQANREGYMSEAQKRRAKRSLWQFIGLYLVLTLSSVWVLGFFIKYIQDTNSIIEKLGIGIAGIVPFLCLAGCFYILKESFQLHDESVEGDEEEKVISLTGTVWLVTEDDKGNYGRMFRVGIDDKFLTVPDSVFDTVKDGQVYTVYYSEKFERLLSMERPDKETRIREIKDDLKYLDSQEASLKSKNDKNA